MSIFKTLGLMTAVGMGAGVEMPKDIKEVVESLNKDPNISELSVSSETLKKMAESYRKSEGIIKRDEAVATLEFGKITSKQVNPEVLLDSKVSAFESVEKKLAIIEVVSELKELKKLKVIEPNVVLEVEEALRESFGSRAKNTAEALVNVVLHGGDKKQIYKIGAVFDGGLEEAVDSIVHFNGDLLLAKSGSIPTSKVLTEADKVAAAAAAAEIAKLKAELEAQKKHARLVNEEKGKPSRSKQITRAIQDQLGVNPDEMINYAQIEGLIKLNGGHTMTSPFADSAATTDMNNGYFRGRTSGADLPSGGFSQTTQISAEEVRAYGRGGAANHVEVDIDKMSSDFMLLIKDGVKNDNINPTTVKKYNKYYNEMLKRAGDDFDKIQLEIKISSEMSKEVAASDGKMTAEQASAIQNKVAVEYETYYDEFGVAQYRKGGSGTNKYERNVGGFREDWRKVTEDQFNHEKSLYSIGQSTEISKIKKERNEARASLMRSQANVLREEQTLNIVKGDYFLLTDPNTGLQYQIAKQGGKVNVYDSKNRTWVPAEAEQYKTLKLNLKRDAEIEKAAHKYNIEKYNTRIEKEKTNQAREKTRQTREKGKELEERVKVITRPTREASRGIENVLKDIQDIIEILDNL